MARLGASGMIAINGVTLGPETWTLGVSIRPIRDSANRTIVKTLYTFTIKTVIVRSAALVEADIFLGLTPAHDDVLELVRAAILRDGGTFYYQRKGIGNIAINVAGGQTDLDWGPRVEEINWRPIGAGIAAEMTFRISFSILDCNIYLAGYPILEFNWTADFDAGRDRLTTARYSGHLKVPQTRLSVDDRTLVRTADQFYDFIIPPLTEGWIRENEHRLLSEDKCTVNFSFTDRMLKAPLEYGIVNMSTTNEMHNEPALQQTQKFGRLSASYEVAMGWDLGIAEFHFEGLRKDKWDWLESQGNIIIPQVYRAVEQQMERRVELEATYRLIRPSGLEGFGLQPILGPQGFYRPSPNASHGVWLARMNAVGFYLPRGLDQSVVTPDQDVIIDLCNNPANPRQGSPYVPSLGDIPDDTTTGEIDPDCPDPEYSWLDWHCWIEYGTHDGVSVRKALPTSPTTKPVAPTRSRGEEWARSQDGFQPFDPAKAGSLGTAQNSLDVQQRTSPSVYVWLVGYAERICHGIPEPILVSVAGSPAIQANRPDHEYYRTRTQGNVGKPIYEAMWRRRYILTIPTSEPITKPDTTKLKPNGPLWSDEDTPILIREDR